MIKREFEINDIACIAKNRRLKAHIDGSETNTKTISLKLGIKLRYWTIMRLKNMDIHMKQNLRKMELCIL
ncbi:hypothetical protein AAIB48_04565 [Paraclostridium benzoelyticum]|uniref:hypothetical protein n=1 Tax=Paraclostridium benzoelyticum TaxID=1629550 RepID=UPI0031CD93BC